MSAALPASAFPTPAMIPHDPLGWHWLYCTESDFFPFSFCEDGDGKSTWDAGFYHEMIFIAQSELIPETIPVLQGCSEY